MLPPLNYTMLEKLVQSADVILDTFPVGNGLTALDAFAMAKPVITLPDAQAPGARYVAGILLCFHLNYISSKPVPL